MINIRKTKIGNRKKYHLFYIKILWFKFEIIWQGLKILVRLEFSYGW